MKMIPKDKIARSRLEKARSSPLQAYKEFTVGADASFFEFLRYELLTFFLGSVSGALGLVLRRRFYRSMFRKAGKGLIIGRNVIIRHPGKIELGDNVTIDDDTLIDARGVGEAGLVLEDNVAINRNCMIQAKAGPIRLGKRTSIGSYSMITSLEGVEFGEAVLTGGRCYFSAGAYHFDDMEIPVMDQGPYSKGPISIGSHAYIGAGVMVVGGLTLGKGAVIGAGAVVIHDVPRGGIAAGVPAKLIKVREQ